MMTETSEARVLELSEGPDFKDGGDDGDYPEVDRWELQVADNGYILITAFDTGEFTTTVFGNIDEALEFVMRQA